MRHAVLSQVLQAMLATAALVLVIGSAAGSTGPLYSEIFKYGDNPDIHVHTSGTSWTYDSAGDDWVGEDAAGNPWICLTGKQQSPINLPLASSAATAIDAAHKAVWQLGSVTANGSNVGVANNGHSVQVFWNDAAYAPSITVAVQEGQPLHTSLDLHSGSDASMVKAMAHQVHFHAHSEHLVHGRIFPLEAHLVSVVEQTELPSCPASGCIVVTAVMFELAQDLDQDNPWLAPLFDMMPYMEQDVAYLPAGTALDLQQFLPANTSYIAYNGSLTTPPCTEGVLWMVLTNTQTMSLKQWRNFMKAVGDYNCTAEGSGGGNDTALSPRIGLADSPLSGHSSDHILTEQPSSSGPAADSNGTRPAAAATNSTTGNRTVTGQPTSLKLTAGAQNGHSTLKDITQPQPQMISVSNPLGSKGSSSIDSNSTVGVPERLLLGISSVKRVASTGLRRHSAEVAGRSQRHVCTKLGAGSNYRLPQPLNQRTLRIWTDESPVKKSFLSADAATAASAGAIAGIVLGVTLGAGLTAGFGYLGWKLYNKRRVDRMYKLGVKDNDMMMVQQEVERQWLTATPNSVAAATEGLAHRSHGDIPL